MFEAETGTKSCTHKFLNVRLPAETFDLLSRYCAEAGQTKTVAVDRALQYYCKRQLDKMRDD